jgi:hypothetical protein
VLRVAIATAGGFGVNFDKLRRFERQSHALLRRGQKCFNRPSGGKNSSTLKSQSRIFRHFVSVCIRHVLGHAAEEKTKTGWKV